MPDARVTVAIPTLEADAKLVECVRAVAAQTFDSLEIVVIDNSGSGRARAALGESRVRLIENERNVGFGAAINQAWRASSSPFIASLNDDAVAHPGWLAALVAAIEADACIGSCGSQVRLHGEDRLDSAGMLIAADGSSRQRGHGRKPREFARPEEILMASGSAALYRRAMLEETGGFDESFFLYCEDTDLGLRARWAGWTCRYVPEAVVEHHYSHTAGRASPLKAYYVERNRLFVLAKNFPARCLVAAPFVSLARYYWHLVSMLEGHSRAAQYREEGGSALMLVWFVVRAHLALMARLPRLLAQRRRIRRQVTTADFLQLMRVHAITAREVAAS